VPAGAAAAPRRFPAGQVVAGRLPQHEVAGSRLYGRLRRGRRPACPPDRGATACRSRRSWPPSNSTWPSAA
jgi:hypothetical protein